MRTKTKPKLVLEMTLFDRPFQRVRSGAQERAERKIVRVRNGEREVGDQNPNGSKERERELTDPVSPIQREDRLSVVVVAATATVFADDDAVEQTRENQKERVQRRRNPSQSPTAGPRSSIPRQWSKNPSRSNRREREHSIERVPPGESSIPVGELFNADLQILLCGSIFFTKMQNR